jgi:glycosyltransferase involved in cell wall biosynthesis
MKLADRVITSGESIRQAMINNNRMSSDLIVSIPAGIDTKQFSLQREMADIRPLFQIPKESFIVGIVGVLRSWKGHHDLIAATKHIRDKIPELKILIVGEGPQRSAIEQHVIEAKLSDIIILTGHQKDPAPFMKAMDVVVLPSYANEATSQVLPQAMAMRRPVISTDIGSLPEVVINEKTGLSIQPRDIDALAGSIIRLYNNRELRKKLATAGYAHVQSKFTFDRMIDATEEVYQKLLAI